MSTPKRNGGIQPWVASTFLGAWWCLTAPLASGAEIDFYRDVYPILKSNCIACHNKTTTKAALNMETPDSMRKGGDSGEGLIPGNATESPIYQAAAHVGPVEMPPKGNKSGASKLTPAELALLKLWIDQGAKSSVKQVQHVVWQPLPSGINPIYSVAMTRDGRFAFCNRANQLFVYDLATRQFVARLTDESLNPPGSSPNAGSAHRALVQSLAISPDGMRLASGSYREVKIWKRQASPPLIRTGDPILGSVVSAISADGKQVLCADKQGTLHLVDNANGKTLKTISTMIQSGISRLSLSPDSARVAVYGADGSLCIWNLAEGKRVARKEGLVGVRNLSFTTDGKAIATGGDDKVIRLWAVPEGENGEIVTIKEFKGATGAITAIEIGADTLIAAGSDGKVHHWSLPDARLIQEFAIVGPVSLALSGNGKQIAIGRADGVVQIWDLASSKPVTDLSGDSDTNAMLADLEGIVAREGLEMSFRKQDATRIEAQNKGLVELLKKTNETIETIRKDLVEKQNGLKLAGESKSASQKALASIIDQIPKAPNGQADPALQKTLKEAQEKLTAANQAENTAQIALKAREIHLKDAEAEAQNYSTTQTRNQSAIASANAALATAKEKQDKATADAVAIKKTVASRNPQPLAVRFSGDAQTVAAVFHDGSLRVWAVASGQPILHVPGVKPTTTASLVACAQGEFAASTAEGDIVRVNTALNWTLERTLGGESASSPLIDRVNALRFSPDGNTLAAGGGEPTRSGDISLWDVASGTLIKDLKERHSDTVLSLDFSPDGKQLASGGADKIARVTEIASGKILNVFEGHSHHVMGVSFRADGRLLATAGADRAVVVWDMISGERKVKVEGWSKEVTSVQFIGATNQILTSAGDNLVRIVDDNGGQVRAMAKLPDFMQSAASSTTANVMIAGGEDGILRVWNGTTGQELATFGVETNAKRP